MIQVATTGDGVTVEGSANGGRVITVPDGKGGTTTISIGTDGITVNGVDIAQQIVGTPQIPVPPVPPAPSVARRRGDVPNGVIAVIAITLGTTAVIKLGTPLVRAIARWIDSKSGNAASSSELVGRLHAIEQAVESVAVEVERISEGQRFTARILSERHDTPAAESVLATNGTPDFSNGQSL